MSMQRIGTGKIQSTIGYPLLLAVLLLSGCAPSFMQNPEQVAPHTYLLEWSPAGRAAVADTKGPALLIGPVLTNPGFNVSDMAYIRQPHQIEYFAHHHWVDTPARMLEPLLLQAAMDSGLFRSVAEASSRTRADLRLDTTLLRLQQLDSPQLAELQFAVRVRLVDMAKSQVLGSRVLSARESLQERTPYAGVQAANRALARLLADLQVFLRQQVGATH